MDKYSTLTSVLLYLTALLGGFKGRRTCGGAHCLKIEAETCASVAVLQVVSGNGVSREQGDKGQDSRESKQKKKKTKKILLVIPYLTASPSQLQSLPFTCGDTDLSMPNSALVFRTNML